MSACRSDTDAASAVYYSDTIAALPCVSCESTPGIAVVTTDDERGKILVATRDYDADTLVWSEDALVGMREFPTSSAVRPSFESCHECLRAIGTIDQEWNRINHAQTEIDNKRRKKKLDKSKKSKKGKQTESNHGEPNDEEGEKEVIQLPNPLPHWTIRNADADSSAATISHPFADSTGSSTAATALPSFSSSSSSLLSSIECAIVPCEHSCGAVYCSTSCRDTAWQHYHAIMCVSSSSLMKYATQHNETFWLAFKAISMCATAAIRRMRECEQITQLFREADIDVNIKDDRTFAFHLVDLLTRLDSHSRIKLESLLSTCVDEAALPFRRFASGENEPRWWNIVRLAPDIDEMDESDERERLCGVMEIGIEKFRAALMKSFDLAVATSNGGGEQTSMTAENVLTLLHLDELVSLDFMSGLMVRFELNNIGYHAPTALGLYKQYIDSLDSSSRSSLIAALTPAVYDSIVDRVNRLGDRIDGTGLFRIGCCMNHSCRPNITIRNKTYDNLHKSYDEYRTLASSSSSSSSSPSSSVVSPTSLLTGLTEFVALEPIRSGDELNISYIDLIRPKSVSASSGSQSISSTRPIHQDAACHHSPDRSPSSTSTPPAADTDTDAEDQFEEIPYEERQRLLSGYGFTCRCQKCSDRR